MPGYNHSAVQDQLNSWTPRQGWMTKNYLEIFRGIKTIETPNAARFTLNLKLSLLCSDSNEGKYHQLSRWNYVRVRNYQIVMLLPFLVIMSHLRHNAMASKVGFWKRPPLLKYLLFEDNFQILTFCLHLLIFKIPFISHGSIGNI